jgi:succinate dehydrogenase / fumarate reductase flavoprotein subunit
LGGNSLGDLLVFGKRAGDYAAAYSAGLGADRPKVPQAEVDAAMVSALSPFSNQGGDNAYTIHQELQQVMQDLVGIIRREHEMEEALSKLAALKERIPHVVVDGHREYNPGWHLSIDLRNMVLVSEAVARAALERKESRGGHTRDDYPGTDDYWAHRNVIVELDDAGAVTIRQQALPEWPEPLANLLEEAH